MVWDPSSNVNQPTWFFEGALNVQKTILLRIDKKIVLFRLIRELTNRVISDIEFFFFKITWHAKYKQIWKLWILIFEPKKFPYLRKKHLLYNAYCNQIFSTKLFDKYHPSWIMNVVTRFGFSTWTDGATRVAAALIKQRVLEF